MYGAETEHPHGAGHAGVCVGLLLSAECAANCERERWHGALFLTYAEAVGRHAEHVRSLPDDCQHTCPDNDNTLSDFMAKT